jgi:8-oxo-dGTP pyrophosphatase MutT (NUDIX family)
MPDPSGPVLRVTARVLPVNHRGEVLLLLDQDPGRPGVARWGTIGGAVDPGETLHQAAVREMHEETGIAIDAAQLLGPVHHDVVPFSYDGRPFIGDSTFFALALAHDVEVVFDHLEPLEVDNVLDHGWWSPEDLAADGRAVLPDLPAIMPKAVEAVHDRSTP